MLKKVLLYISLTGILMANVDIPNNQCAIIISSSKYLYEIKDYINNNIDDQTYLNVYQSNNGRYAISIGFLKDYQVKNIMKRWKRSGKIPSDSFCAKSYKFTRELNVNEYRNNYKTYSNNLEHSKSTNYTPENTVSEEETYTIGDLLTLTPWGRGFKFLKTLKK
jgi:hypothetical protein